MARSNGSENGSDDISIVGPGMTVVGDMTTEGTVRIEGRVEGNVTAGKAVVIGKDGEIRGDIKTQDAVVSGHVDGTLLAASRLEVQASARVDGEIAARRLQLEEGAMLNGTVQMGEIEMGRSPSSGGREDESDVETQGVSTAPGGR